MSRATLYTSLARIKMSLNNGVLPPMTELTREAKRVVNPKYSLGMGAIVEDERRGLQCPVCGGWFHLLTKHINAAHIDLGGAMAVKRALSIPRSVALVSARTRGLMSDQMNARRQAGIMAIGGRAAVAKRRRVGERVPWVGTRNMANTCEAQLINRILAVRDVLRRDPSRREAAQIDPPLVEAARHYFGSWNAAKAAANLRAFPSNNGRAVKKYSPDDVVEAFRAFLRERGRLPTTAELREPTLPALPHKRTICKHMQTDSLPAALMRVRARLEIAGDLAQVRERQEGVA